MTFEVSGEFGDLKNVPKLLENIDLSRYTSDISIIRSRLAKHDLIENIDELAMDGGFFDIFADKSKFDSFGQNLTAQPPKIEDVEDGTAELFDLSDDDFSIDSNSEINGTNSVKLQTSTTDDFAFESVNFRRNFVGGDKFEAKIKRTTLNSTRFDDSLSIELEGRFDNAITIEFQSRNREIVVNGDDTIFGKWSVGTIQNVEVIFDMFNTEADISINSVTNTVNFNNNTVEEVSSMRIRLSNQVSGNTDTAFIDDYSVEGGESLKTPTIEALTLNSGDPEGKVRVKPDIGGVTSFDAVPSTGSASSGVSFDVELKREGIVQSVGFEPDDSGEVEAVVSGSGGNVLARKTKNVTSGNFETVNFAESDYSRIPSGEKLEVKFESTGSTIFFERASNQLFEAAEVEVYGTISAFNNNGGKFLVVDTGEPGSESFVQSTNLSSGDDNFSNPPDTLVINQDADLSTGDIEYTVRDQNGSGNDKIVTQNDLTQEVDLSDFTGLEIEIETELTSVKKGEVPVLRSQDFYFSEGS